MASIKFSERSWRFSGLFVAALLWLICFTPRLRSEVGASLRHAGAFDQFAVASDHPLASEVGASILARGGNAADAAVATALALGVLHPASSGLGGGGFFLYYRALDRELFFLDFRECAPSKAHPTMFANGASSEVGGLAVALPGEPAGLEAILDRFGSGRVSRREIAEAAARLAEQGFPASRSLSRYSAETPALDRDELFRSFFPPNSDRIPEGHLLRNLQLAKTLRRFGVEGSRPFYQGDIAQAIVREVRKRGGILTMEDFRNYRPIERKPIEGLRFGHRWVTAPPPSAGGVTLLQSLAFVEALLPHPREGARFRHVLAESWKGAFLDRMRYLGDPDFVQVPVQSLLDPSRVRLRVERFQPFLAQPSAVYDIDALLPTPEPQREGGTTHICVVDGNGNVAALTSTINLPFGARFSVLGMVMNDEMDDFAKGIGLPNAFGLPGGAANMIKPGKRPVSTMTPTIVFDGERPRLCIGGSGGSRIVTAVEQVALFVLLLGDELETALVRPRIHHQGIPDVLSHEGSLEAWIREGLGLRGHTLNSVEAIATVQAIEIRYTPDGRRLIFAGSDPRKGGAPSGR
ncbi:MAG: gamma-glutamyltransferase [Sandaracinaceae bacterium]|nr:gamma-glutamyltransferase [Sandaracinaceae bacterium]